MSPPDILDALGALGFNLNEARAYAALVQLGPATGYEVGQRAGVPRSAVYGVLRRLVDRGAARSLGAAPERFVATPPGELLELWRKRLEASGRALETAVQRLHVEPATPDAFGVKGYDRVLEEAARLVSGARRALYASGWPRELGALGEELAAAQARGVHVVLFSHSALPDTLAGLHYGYGLPEDRLEEFWPHRLVMVADDRRTLVAATEQAPGDTAVLSETAAIAELVLSQIALDITLLAQRHGHDTRKVMAKMLGDRVGRLDELLARGSVPALGTMRRPGRGKRAKAPG
jgi:sugar-specific transcriptional regulator TrmB